MFTPSADTRTIYVSSSIGRDTNDGLSQATPVKTLAKGKSLLRNGQPDWLLLRKGDTWTNEAIGQVCTSGRSATEPMLISSYGSGARPLIKTTPALGSGISTSGSGGCGAIAAAGSGDYLAVVGLEFYAYTRDPNSPDFNLSTVATSQAGFIFLSVSHWLLLEDNKFSFYGGNAVQAWPTGSGLFRNVILRRNVIVDNYATVGHCQGLFTSDTSNLVIEENVWDHNGWNEQVAGANATIFNRSMYLSHGDGNTTVRGNIDANGASGGVQIRTGGIADDNLFLRTPVSIRFGSDQNQAIDVSGAIRNNVILGGRDIGNAGDPGSQLNGTGIWISSNAANTQGANSFGDSFVKDLDVHSNIIAHNELGTGNIAGILMGNTGNASFTNTNIHDNIVYDWTRAVWPTANDHRAVGFAIRVGTSTPTLNTSFHNNIIQQVRSGFVGFTSNYDTTSGIVMRDNRYWSTEADVPTIWSSGWFELDGLNSESWDSWVSHTGETGSTKELVNFTAPGRDVSTYMASLGMPPTYEAFMAKARQQSKDSWDVRFTASAVNDYVRAGFDASYSP